MSEHQQLTVETIEISPDPSPMEVGWAIDRLTGRTGNRTLVRQEIPAGVANAYHVGDYRVIVAYDLQRDRRVARVSCAFEEKETPCP